MKKIFKDFSGLELEHCSVAFILGMNLKKKEQGSTKMIEEMLGRGTGFVPY